jgi:hypothetical protein
MLEKYMLRKEIKAKTIQQNNDASSLVKSAHRKRAKRRASKRLRRLKSP